MNNLKDIQEMVLSGEMSLDIPMIDNELAELAKRSGMKPYTEIKREIDLKHIWSFFNRDGNDPYYSVKAVSYSFLKHLEKVATGKASFNKGNDFKPFQLGRAFEDMFTDRFNPNWFPSLTLDDLADCRQWCENAKQNNFIRHVYFDNTPEIQKEYIREWNGLNWKCKTDAELDFAVFDLKTTSAKSQAEFEASCTKFGYFGQGVVYCEMSNKPFFTLLGVSKKVNEVFPYTMNSSDYKAGKCEIERLLNYLDYFGIRKEFEV